MISEPRASLLSYLLPLSFIGLCIALVCYFQGNGFEEVAWAHRVANFLNEPSFDNLTDTLRRHFGFQWNIDNIRLIQVVGIFLYMLPDPVVCAICGIVAVWMFQSISVLCGVWRRNFFAFSALCLALVVLLPWYDLLSITNFLLNYALAEALFAYLLWRWLVDHRPFRPLSALTLGFLAAWCHEQFAAMVITSVVVVCIIYPRTRNRSSLLLFIGAIIALLVFIISPASRMRFSFADSTWAIFVTPTWFLHNFISLAGLLAAVIVLCRGRLRQRLCSPLFIALSSSALVALIVSARLGITGRVAFASASCAICIFFLYLKFINPSELLKKIRPVAILLFWLGIAAHYALTIFQAYSYYPLIRDAKARYNPSTDSYPLAFASLPENNLATILLTLKKLSVSVNFLGLENMATFPEQLRDFRPQLADTLASSDPSKTFFFYNGFLLAQLPEVSDPIERVCLFRDTTLVAEELVYTVKMPTPDGDFYSIAPMSRTTRTVPFAGTNPDSIAIHSSDNFLRLASVWVEP